MSYQRMDHAGWVEDNNAASNQINRNRKAYKPQPECLTDDQARIMDIVGMVGGGIYNAPINWEKVDWRYGGGVAVPFRDGRFSTFDFYALTQLVFLCHEARIRCEVRAQASGHFMLIFHPRRHEGGMASRHPNLDEAVAAFREYLPANHRIIYQMPVQAEAA
jgi:hypothetical protein